MIPRRSIDELLARYELEPSLYDIFVEGIFDKNMLDATFDTPTDATTVYEIDSIEISYDTLKIYNLSEGRKQRVVSLAYILQEKLPDHKTKFLIDLDFDKWGETEYAAKNLYKTRYNALEVEFLSEINLKDIIVLCAESKIKDDDWRDFYGSFEEYLFTCYSIRASAAVLKISMDWPDPRKNLTKNLNRMTFDLERYFSQIDSLNKDHTLSARLREFSSEWRADKCKSSKEYVRGHDMIEGISWVVSKFKGNSGFSTDSAVSRILVYYVE